MVLRDVFLILDSSFSCFISENGFFMPIRNKSSYFILWINKESNKPFPLLVDLL